MNRLVLLAASLLLVAGCALRPRYADFVSPTTPGDSVTFVLTEKEKGEPLAGVDVEVGENKQRVRVKTGPDGTFSLPVSASFVKDNPVLVISLPRGVSGYDLEVVHRAVPVSPPPEAPAPAPASPAPAPPPAPASPEAPASPPAPANG